MRWSKRYLQLVLIRCFGRIAVVVDVEFDVEAVPVVVNCTSHEGVPHEDVPNLRHSRSRFGSCSQATQGTPRKVAAREVTVSG